MNSKLILFEDNSRLRASLEILINGENDFNVVGTFPNCNDCAEKVEILKPDLVIMDINMPGMSGIEGVSKIKSKFPEIKIIMHTVFEDDQHIFDALCAGADGYLLKNSSPLQLVTSLKELQDGGAPMSPYVAQKVLSHFRKSKNQDKNEDEDFHLSEREKEILTLLVHGNSYKMISTNLAISNETVKKHIQNIYFKLQVNCGTEAVAKALKYKIVNI